MKDKRIKEMTLFSMFLAIIIVLTVIPQIGYISIGGIASITIIHIPIIIGCIILGRKYSWLLGLVFGCSSLLIAWIRPSSIMDPYFQNPLISVLPRVLFAVVAYEIYNLLSKVFKRKLNAIAIALTAFVSTLLHTIFVSSSCYIFTHAKMVTDGYLGEDASLFAAIALFIVAGTFEAIAALIVTTPVCTAVLQIEGKEKEEEE